MNKSKIKEIFEEHWDDFLICIQKKMLYYFLVLQPYDILSSKNNIYMDKTKNNYQLLLNLSVSKIFCQDVNNLL